MLITQQTTYRCNGCLTEAVDPIGWVNLANRPGLSFVGVMTSTNAQSEDYCQTCITKMRQTVRGIETT